MSELYDDAFVATLPELVPWENPWVVGICRLKHNEPLRQSIEKWFRLLPDAVKPDFRTKLRSLNNAEFIATFYELVVHQYCLEEGWTIEYEAEVLPGKTPDFIVTTPDGYRFVIEVATIFESQEVAKILSNQDAMDKAVSRIKTKIGLEINHNQKPTLVADYRHIVKKIETWVRDVESGNARNRISFSEDGYDFSVTARGKNSGSSNGAVTSIMSGGSVPNYGQRIRDVIEKKNKKYSSKKTGLPLVVVMAGGGLSLNTDLFAVDKALYGDHTISFPANGIGESTWGRDKSGLFTPRQSEGRQQGKTTGVSAVLYIRHQGEYENGMNNFQMAMMHNLLPHIPLKLDIFEKLIPQYRVKNVTPTSIVMEWSIQDHEDKRVGFDYSDK